MNRRPLVVCALAGLLLGTPVVSRAIDSIAARERIGVRVGGLSTNDGLNDAYGTGLNAVVKEVFEASGGTVVAEASYNDGDTSFDAQVATVTAANPDRT